MEWTDTHLAVCDAFKAGRNLFITGSAGTGKTVLLRRLIELAGDGAGVQCTALTGLAALALQGVTLHKFSGCGLAAGEVEGLVMRLSKEARKRWCETRVLFIDEVSMMDADLFEKFDEVARRVRGRRAALWGGIQLVMVGDFFQLPPVSKDDDPKRMLFESEVFRGEEVEKMRLTHVFRQKDPRLLELLQAARFGELEAAHVELLQSLRRPIEKEGLMPTKLYPLNRLVDAENERRLAGSACSGEVHAFKATDVGRKADVEYLMKNCMAASVLELRMGAQVIYIANHKFDRALVNGARGVVTGWGAGGLPVVRFSDGRTREVHAHTWQNRVPHGNKVVASREQIPLKLAWALSVHKSQGEGLLQVERCLAPVLTGAVVQA